MSRPSELELPSSSFRFSVRACTDPETLARITAVLAKQGIVPRRLRCDAHGKDDEMRIDVELEGLSDAMVIKIGRRLQAQLCVTAVLRTSVSA